MEADERRSKPPVSAFNRAHLRSSAFPFLVTASSRWWRRVSSRTRVGGGQLHTCENVLSDGHGLVRRPLERRRPKREVAQPEPLRLVVVAVLGAGHDCELVLDAHLGQ